MTTSSPSDQSTGPFTLSPSDRGLLAGKSPIKVLFLAANPSYITRTRSDSEAHDIISALRHAKYGDRFEFIQIPAVQVGELHSLLRDHKPHIVHFSGHGSDSGDIILENSIGQAHLVEPEALRDTFALLRNNIFCVVLNACYTKILAEAIAKNIEYVVGMSTEVSDKAAISFASHFYQALASEPNVPKAFELGRNQIALECPDEKDTPQLWPIPNDPTQVVYVPKERVDTPSDAKDVLERVINENDLVSDQPHARISEKEKWFRKFFGLTNVDDRSVIILPRFDTSEVDAKLTSMREFLEAQALLKERRENQIKDLRHIASLIETSKDSSVFTSWANEFEASCNSLMQLHSQLKDILTTNLDQDDANTNKLYHEITNVTLAQVDVEVYHYIRDIFSENAKYRQPEIDWDDTIRDQFKNSSSGLAKFRVLISVGLFSNVFTMGFFPKESTKSDVTEGSPRSQPIDLERGLPFRLVRVDDHNNIIEWRVRGDWKNVADKNSVKKDYALLAHIKISRDQYLMIIGGITAKATQKIGDYLSSNWKELCETEIYPKLVEGDEFILLFELSPDNPVPRERVRKIKEDFSGKWLDSTG